MRRPIGITVFGIDSRGMLTGPDIGMNQDFWYVDDSYSGLVDIDMAAMYVDFDKLQILCWMNGSDNNAKRANEIRVKLADGVDLYDGRAEIAGLWAEFVSRYEKLGQAKLLKDVTVQTWQQFRRSNIAPIEKEKAMMIIVFIMIGGIAVFIIFAIFYMIVTEKIKDLGIVRSAGGSSCGVGQVFIGFGALVGVTGAILGTALGYAIVLNTNRIEDLLYDNFGFRLWSPDIYDISKIPDVVNYSEAMVIAVTAILASVAGAVIPAWRAARLNVVEALRVE